MSSVAQLNSVDRSVRKTLTYAKDDAAHGFDDWSLPEESGVKGLGDCEDFMMFAAGRLLDLGADPAKMYFVLCHTGGFEGFNHAFLAVETDEGLHTCADTYTGPPQPIYAAYGRDELRQWRRVSEKGWRLWADD